MGYRGGLNVTQVNPKRGADVRRQTTAQSIPNNTRTEIVYDTEQEDTSNYYATGASSIIVPGGLAGFYVIAAKADFAANAVGSRELRILVNGTVLAGQGSATVATAGVQWRGSAVVVAPLVAGDVVTADVFQDSGGALTVVGALAVYRVAA